VIHLRHGVWCALAFAFLLATLPSPSLADTSRDALLFSITKSENRNYVQFAIRMDTRCAPEGDAPVHAWWRMQEHGPDAVEPVLEREEPAYGIASQAVIDRHEGGGAARITLRALPRQTIAVETYRGREGCEARARLAIDGVDARLFNVHAVLAWPFGVSRLIVTGWATGEGRRGQVVRDERRPQ
jgi:hypothetical protein